MPLGTQLLFLLSSHSLLGPSWQACPQAYTELSTGKPCCRGQKEAEAQLARGSSSCSPALALCWCLRVLGQKKFIPEGAHDRMDPVPHILSTLLRQEEKVQVGVC